MIPRYVPALPSFTRSGRAVDGRARSSLLDALAGPHAPTHDRAFSQLRHGLHEYFEQIRGGSRDTVLMSAQVCPVVPLAVRAAGLRTRFVDISARRPTPEAAQYISVLDEDVAVVLVAPIYGQISSQWNPLSENLRGARLVLDLAQGIGLGERLDPLIKIADAVGFSFGLGKGLDTGGSLLLTRRELFTSRAESRSRSLGPGPALRSAALWFLARTGLYAFIPPAFIEGRSSEDRFVPRVDGGETIPDYARWNVALEEFLRAVDLARARARLLSELLSGASIECREACFDPESTHLRQIVRVAHSASRDVLVTRLRRAGIDCSAAGERLPHEYLENAPTAAAFPNAVRFKGEAIRLPFLGRLTEAEFGQLQLALEKVIVGLPH